VTIGPDAVGPARAHYIHADAGDSSPFRLCGEHFAFDNGVGHVPKAFDLVDRLGHSRRIG
jgi:hypothetical protein